MLIKQRRIHGVCATFLILFFVAGCGGGNITNPTPTPTSTSTPNQNGAPTEAEILNVTPPTLKEFAQAFEATTSENPGIDQNSGQFKRLLFEKIKKRTSGARRQTRSFELLGINLKNREWLLAVGSPVFAYKTNALTEEAQTASKIQYPETVSSPSYLTKQDAFRHSYWNAIMAKECSVAWAKTFSDAHETEAPAGYEDDVAMDLSNNAVGRKVYLTNTSYTKADLQNALKAQKFEQVQSNISIDDSILVYMRPYKINNIESDSASYSVGVGSQITAKFDSQGSDKKPVNIIGFLRKELIKFESEDSTIASVNAAFVDGNNEIKAVISGVKKGETKIKITITEGADKKTKTVDVKVGKGLLDGTWRGTVAVPGVGSCTAGSQSAIYIFNDDNGDKGGPISGSFVVGRVSGNFTGTRTGKSYVLSAGDRGNVSGDRLTNTAPFQCIPDGSATSLTFSLMRDQTTAQSIGRFSAKDDCSSCAVKSVK